jgi:hypothetical protein
MRQDAMTTQNPAGTDDAPNSRPPAGTDADLVIREARRRQRRRRRVTVLVVAVLLAGAIGVAAGLQAQGPRPASQPRPSAAARGPQVPPGPIPRSASTTLLMWPVVAQGEYPTFGPNQWPPAYLDDLATGHLSRRHKLAFAGGDYLPYLVQAGHWLVYVGGRGAMAIRDSLKGRPRVVGKTPFFAPAASAGRIWLERIHGDMGVHGRASVWLASVRTGHHGPVIALPRNSTLIAGTRAGLLLEVLRGRDFSLALWRPGGTPQLLPYAPRHGDALDASAQLVAYGTGCRGHATAGNNYLPACRVLRVYNVVTGRLLSFGAPPGTAGWIPFGIGVTHAIAPGGRMIAAYAAPLPLGQGRDRLFALRLSGTGGPPRAMPFSAAHAALDPRTAWSAGGSWLFYQGPRGRLWAYQVSSGRAYASGTPCCAYTVMAAFPSAHR